MKKGEKWQWIDGDEYCHRELVRADSGLEPGDTHSILYHGSDWPMDEDKMAVIAAAPDLLEALQECLPDLQHYVATHGQGPDKRLDKAIAAISKAIS